MKQNNTTHSAKAEAPSLRKDTLAAFLISFAVLLAACGVMLATRYSTDGYSDYFMELSGRNIQWKLELGRPGGAAAEALLHALHINTVTAQLPFTLLLLAVLAWCCAGLWSAVMPCWTQQTRWAKAVVLILILPTFINVSVGEYFFFSNCAVHWIGMFVFAQMALWALLSPRWTGKLLSFVFLAASLSFYQASIGYFVIWGLLLVFLRSGLNADGKTIRRLAWVIVIGAGAGAFSVVLQRVMEWLNVTAGTERSPASGLHILLQNARFLLTVGQRNVLVRGMGFLGVSLGAAVVILTLMMLCTCAWAKKDRTVLLVLLMALVCYGICYAPHLISSSIWMAPRTMPGVYAYISFCALLTVYYGWREKTLPQTVTVLVCLFVLLNVKAVYTIGLEQITNNRADRLQAMEILARVEAYERERGITVDKVAIVQDKGVTYSNPGVEHVYMDINLRSGAVSWAAPYALMYYGNREFKIIDVPEDIYLQYFADREWNGFLPEEQVVLVGDALYLGEY